MDNITKQLQGCSKAELIEVIMEMKRHSIGIGVTWESVIANARLRTIEDKLDEILQHQEKLHEKMNAIPKERRVIWDSETREILNGFQKSNERYVKLSKLHDKIFEETYRKKPKQRTCSAVCRGRSPGTDDGRPSNLITE